MLILLQQVMVLRLGLKSGKTFFWNHFNSDCDTDSPFVNGCESLTVCAPCLSYSSITIIIVAYMEVEAFSVWKSNLHCHHCTQWERGKWSGCSHLLTLSPWLALPILLGWLGMKRITAVLIPRIWKGDGILSSLSSDLCKGGCRESSSRLSRTSCYCYSPQLGLIPRTASVLSLVLLLQKWELGPLLWKLWAKRTGKWTLNWHKEESYWLSTVQALPSTHLFLLL